MNNINQTKDMIAIKVSNLSFSYGENKIISNLSFEINKGDFVCIIGSNGAGKSTLLNLMLNILSPTSGTIDIKDINKKNSGEISYVAQNSTHFNPSFPATVKEIVSLGLKTFNIFQNNNKKISDALSKVGMSDYLNTKIGNLSGGQKQRVILAKALANNPKYIFLDEPTTGVDNHAVHAICSLLGEINKKYKITIVMVTHDIASIIKHATKIINFGKSVNIISAKKFDFNLFYHGDIYQ